MKEIGGARIRPVGIVDPVNLDDAIAEAERLIANGCRAICSPSSNPPGGVSPGDPAVDPLWRTIADGNVPFVLHLAMDWGFMRHSVWGRFPAFARSSESMYDSHEFPGPDPYWGSTQHMGNENWLASMILGGVFERHPTLRMGVIENGAIWVGPLADRLDQWAEVFPSTAARTMSVRPSEYLARNVRVTPLYFERVRTYLDRWPHLQDVYAFSSDYPHPEGGKNTPQRLYEQLKPLGADVLEKYFRLNGELLLPA
jgi:predicted TIM-barrel fold metal-dependent hydrolase